MQMNPDPSLLDFWGSYTGEVSLCFPLSPFLHAARRPCFSQSGTQFETAVSFDSVTCEPSYLHGHHTQVLQRKKHKEAHKIHAHILECAQYLLTVYMFLS